VDADDDSHAAAAAGTDALRWGFGGRFFQGSDKQRTAGVEGDALAFEFSGGIGKNTEGL